VAGPGRQVKQNQLQSTCDPVAQLVEQRTFKRAPSLGAPRFMGRDSPDSTGFSALVASHRPSLRPSETPRTKPRVWRSGLALAAVGGTVIDEQ